MAPNKGLLADEKFQGFLSPSGGTSTRLGCLSSSLFFHVASVPVATECLTQAFGTQNCFIPSAGISYNVSHSYHFVSETVVISIDALFLL